MCYNQFMDKKYFIARKLRKNTTLQEYKIWCLLKNRQLNGLKFVRQYPIGSYIVDFACRKEKLIIEIDGGQHNFDENIVFDNKRTEFLINNGYKIIRFWNNEIDENIEGVYLRLQEFIQNALS